MDTPADAVEVFIRLIFAVTVTVVFGIGLYGQRFMRANPGWWLLIYLVGVIGLNAVWRWYIFWLGIRPDVGYNEPLVRTIGSALALLVYFAIGMLMVHHTLTRARRQ